MQKKVMVVLLMLKAFIPGCIYRGASKVKAGVWHVCEDQRTRHHHRARSTCAGPLRALGPGAEPQPSVSVSTLNVPTVTLL